MYSSQRRTGNLIVPLGLILVVFVGYNIWVKRADTRISTPPPTAEIPSPDATVQADSRISPQGLEPIKPVLPDLQPSLPELTSKAPTETEPFAESKHLAALLTIRTLIEQQNDVEAETRLKLLREEALNEPDVKLAVAILWNNLGVLQKKTQGPDVAIATYKTGLALEPKNPALNLNLAQVYWDTHDPALSREFLEELVILAPQHPFPHMALADILYAEDDLSGAADHLEAAKQLAQADPQLTAYLDFVAARVREAGSTEEQLVARASSHFVVKFDGGEDRAIWREVLNNLEDAYRDIGQKFQYFPSEPIHVVLLTREQFGTASGSPAWADALFDPVLGRIKVPTQGALTNREWLRQVLRHEYVHALIHARMGVQAGKVPAWLNEGLAMQLAGDTWPDIDVVAQHRNIKLLPLSALHGGWGALGIDGATLAYLQANSATKYMIGRYGMWRVTGILDLLKEGHTIDGAIHQKLMISYEVFERRWANTLGSNLAVRRR